MKSKRLDFSGFNNDKCYIIKIGNVYNYYVNGFFVKSIKAIRKYYIISAMNAFLDKTIYDASLNFYFIENN